MTAPTPADTPDLPTRTRQVSRHRPIRRVELPLTGFTTWLASYGISEATQKVYASAVRKVISILKWRSGVTIDEFDPGAVTVSDLETAFEDVLKASRYATASAWDAFATYCGTIGVETAFVPRSVRGTWGRKRTTGLPAEVVAAIHALREALGTRRLSARFITGLAWAHLDVDPGANCAKITAEGRVLRLIGDQIDAIHTIWTYAVDGPMTEKTIRAYGEVAFVPVRPRSTVPVSYAALMRVLAGRSVAIRGRKRRYVGLNRPIKGA